MPTVTEVGQPRVESLLEIWKPVRVQQRQATAHVLHLLPPRPLFADSLLDLDKQEINRRKCAAVLSFMFQCLLIGTLLIVPLMFTEELPRQQLLTFLVAPPPPPPPLPAAEAMAKVVRQIQSDLMTSGQLRTPSRIPQTVQIIHEEEIPPASPSMGGVVGGVVGGVPGGATRRGHWRHCQPNLDSGGSAEARRPTAQTNSHFAGSHQGIVNSEDRT